MRREKTEGSIVGGAIGVIVWLFDFRYLVLGGQPDAEISRYIRGLLSIGGKSVIDSACGLGRFEINNVCSNLATLLILVAVGFVSGGFIVSVFQKARRRD